MQKVVRDMGKVRAVSKTDNNKYIAIGLAAIGVSVVGGIVYYLKKKNAEKKDDVQEFGIVERSGTTPLVTEESVGEFAFKREKSYDVDSLLNREPSTTGDAIQSRASSASTAASSLPDKAVTNAAEGVYVYDNLGCVLRLPKAYKVADDMSPVPNVAMVTIQHVDYASPGQSEMPGASPVLILSVEDTSMEGLDLFEFKEKSKATAMNQMYMMTNGMVPPKINIDGPLEVGSFKMGLQYDMISPFMQMKVLNLITLENSLAYVLQFMASPAIYAKHESEIMEIARNIQITKLPFTGPPSHTIVQSKKGGFTISIPVNWVVTSVARDERSALVANTPSPTKPESIELLRSKGPVWTPEQLEAICKEDRGTRDKMSMKDGVTVMKYKNVASHDVLVLSRDSFCLKVTPIKAATSTLAESELLKILNGAIPTATEDSMRYRNLRNSYSFTCKENSRLVESRIGDNAVTFAPEGIQNDPNSPDATPIFTVRVGDPSTDKECEASLEKWMERLTDESSKSEVSMQELRYDTFNEHKCVSFTQQEMQEIGQGQREEHKAKIIVFVEGGKTFMLRWETPSGVWRKYESKLYRLMDSFAFVA